MKHPTIITAVSLAVAFAVALGAVVQSGSKRTRALSKELASVRLALTNAQSDSVTRQETVAILESKLTKVTEVLTNSTAQLRAALETVHGYELADQERAKAQEEAKKVLAQLPAPKLTSERDQYGNGVKVFTFPVLMDSNGNVVARDARFGKRFGSRLTFWPESGPMAMDVDRVHPAILKHLGIDAEAAKHEQAGIDRAWLAKDAADLRAAAEQQRQAQARWEAAERVRIEQETANAEIAKNQAQQQAIQEAARNDRLRAEAAVTAANAAMIQAQNPQPGVVVQNQNINRNYR